ncbi:hypothetical protein IJQ19_02170 [bacterium]|nr:hypothetical protein [bacterium]
MRIKTAVDKKYKTVRTSKNNKTFINMNIRNDECYTRRVEADRLVDYIIRHKIVKKTEKI